MNSSAAGRNGRGQLVLVLALLSGVLLLCFWRGFLPGHVLFSNDGPLGAQVMDAHRLPQIFTGDWNDLNSVGFRESGASPNFTFGLEYLVGPYWYSTLYIPTALLILGLGAWCFFRQQGFAPAACMLGGLAAVLNSLFFSASCWGVASHAICIGMVFFCLAALADNSSRWRWWRVALGGFALGMAVVEGADIGAIFSLYVAVFIMYQAWISGGTTLTRMATGIGRVALVAGLSGIVAAQIVSVLIGTQIQGVAGMKDSQSKEDRWDWATQWSLPKREVLGLVAPGVFGYRMDTPSGMWEPLRSHYEGGVYWGAVGRDPGWYAYWANGKQGPQPQGGLRFSGNGIYAGALVALVAFWAALQTFRKQNSVFSPPQQQIVKFWVLVIVISLPLAFGRFAPFYRLVYSIPYISAFRNPGKFLYPVTWALVILFGYGMDGLWRRYMEGPAGAYAGVAATVKAWWQRVRGFDRRWTGWSLAVLAGCLVGWLVYASNRQGLENYLQEVGYGDPAMASAIASFSYGQVGWFVLSLAVAIVLVTLVLSGVFKGPRAKWGAVLLGLFIVVDLGRANQPWIIVWDYNKKYATNPVIDMLRQKPYQQRVAILPRYFGSIPWEQLGTQLGLNLPADLADRQRYVAQLYGIEWAQHHFLYYNIQSLDVIQMPRMPEDLLGFEVAFQPRDIGDFARTLPRKWQLTNTRYLIGAAGLLDVLNRLVDPVQHRFRYAERFSITAKPDVLHPSDLQDLTAVPDTNGPYAVFEFTGALPRAKLYSNWQVSTNDQAALKEIASPSFDPQKSLVVTGNAPAPTTSTSTNQNDGTVDFTSYAPKDLVFKAQATAPSVMLLNDRYDPNWKVLVDGKPETLLKCNYFMRGVFLNPGAHTVEFRFQPPTSTFYVSLLGVCLGLLLCGFLLTARKGPPPEPAPVEQQKPQRRLAGAKAGTSERRSVGASEGRRVKASER